MSNFTIHSGLVNVGGILTETKVRNARATPEALTGLGLDPTQTYKSSIGIASIQEYLVMYAEDDTVYFNIGVFEQSVKLESIFIADANQDKFVFEVWRGTEKQLFKQTFQRSDTPIQMPSAPLPPTTIIRFTPLVHIDYIQLAFTICDIIGSVDAKAPPPPVNP